MPPRQLILDLPVRTSTGRDDFFVTAANEAAVGVIDAWPDWPAPVMVLVGPAGSGKSHLGEVWMALSGAAMVKAAAINATQIKKANRNNGRCRVRILFRMWRIWVQVR